MIVDSSAIVAILKQEAEAAEFLELLTNDEARMSVATWFEAAIVLDSAPTIGSAQYDALIDELGIELIEVTNTQAIRARNAYRRYGKGSGSPAKLNFGDCFAYALSAESGEPLLFKGEDFTHTDVLSATA